MHRLRTCATRLRPITASQTAQSLSQQRPAVFNRTLQSIRRYTAPVAAEPFLNGTSSNYVEEMYYAWLENPKSVHKVGEVWNTGAGRQSLQLCSWTLPVICGCSITHIIYHTLPVVQTLLNVNTSVSPE